jgi:predicted HD superfamily hydrolase involved in NAD metabolism
MKPETRVKLTELVTSHIKDQRLLHCIGMVLAGLELATRWNVDLEKAYLVAILHDVGRYLTPEEMLSYIEKHGGGIPDEDQDFPQLWHGSYAAEVLRHELGIRDEELAHALIWHSTGEAGMTTLQKVVFLADSIEFTRDFEGVGELRKLADIDLDKTLLRTIEKKYNYLKTHGTAIHPRLTRARDYYLQEGAL